MYTVYGDLSIFIQFVFGKKVLCCLLFSHSVMSDSATPWTAAGQASLSFTILRNLPKLMSLSQWCHLIIASSVTLFSPLHPSFPESGCFPLSQLFTSGGQSIGASASASVLPINIHGWFPLGLIDLISLLFKGLSRVFSSATIQKQPFFSSQPSLRSNSRTIHDYWKNDSFDCQDFCQQSDVSVF